MKRSLTACQIQNGHQPGPTVVNRSQPGPLMSLHMMDKKLKLDKQKMKQIHGTRFMFEIRGIGFRVRQVD